MIGILPGAKTNAYRQVGNAISGRLWRKAAGRKSARALRKRGACTASAGKAAPVKRMVALDSCVHAGPSGHALAGPHWPPRSRRAGQARSAGPPVAAMPTHLPVDDVES